MLIRLSVRNNENGGGICTYGTADFPISQIKEQQVRIT